MSLLVVRDLGKSFGGLTAVDEVSFSIRPGELLALIGPNGAGKTTTFNMINGHMPILYLYTSLLLVICSPRLFDSLSFQAQGCNSWELWF